MMLSMENEIKYIYYYMLSRRLKVICISIKYFYVDVKGEINS